MVVHVSPSKLSTNFRNYIYTERDRERVYVDVDYANDEDTRISLSDFVFALFGMTISWKENQQSLWRYLPLN